MTVLLGFTPALLSAQFVRGVVVEDGSGTPVGGAMVILLDAGADDAPVDRVLTDAAGEFTTDADHPGRYRLRVDRIGYASLTSDPFDVPPNGAYRRVAVPIEPVRLRGLDVAGERRCEVRPAEGRVTAQVWEEARKALAAAAWTLEKGMYRYTLLTYERDLDRQGEQIVDETRRFSQGWTTAPFVSAPIEDLIEKGFVYEVADSGSVYNAPDAEAFLSRHFLDTHCLGVRQGEDGLIGLTFAPVAERTVPEIAGVLWLDAESAQLKWLEFGYVNLNRLRDVGEPGGEVVFTRLPSGTWIVREWRIRMPKLALTSRGIRRLGYRDAGGVAWRVSDQAGDIVLEAASSSISGTVRDSIRSAPPATPVRVEIAEIGAVETQPDGSFVLPGLPEGRHGLRVRHELLDTLRVAAPEVSVMAMLGEVVHATLPVPTLRDALDEHCGGPPRPKNSAPVLGRIVSAAGQPKRAATVVLRWIASASFEPISMSVPPGPNGEPESEWRLGREGAYATVETKTDTRGIFVLCDVPHGSRLRWEVSVEGTLVASGRLGVPYGAYVVVERIEIEEGREP